MEAFKKRPYNLMIQALVPHIIPRMHDGTESAITIP